MEEIKLKICKHALT